MHDSDGKTVPVVGSVTIRFVRGPSAPAKVDRFFVIDNLTVTIDNPEITCDFQWASFIHFKKGIQLFHDRRD